MNTKKTLSAVLAAAMALGFASATAFAAPAAIDRSGTISPITVVDEDGVAYNTMGVNVDHSVVGKLSIDTVTPKSTIYINLSDAAIANTRGTAATAKDFGDDKLFKFSVDKDTNGKLVKSITLETDKRVGSSTHDNWVKIELNENTMTSEQKFEGSVSFKAKKSSDAAAPYNGFSGDIAYVGDTYKLNLNIWVNNQKVTDGDNPEAGDHVFFDPTKDDTNTLIWGDDRAALKFDASSDTDKFYARLSTKSMPEIYREYGDPVNADLYFFDFIGNPTVPSTSRATLTLGMPWDNDDDNAPSSSDCFIYQINSEGELSDVTSLFSYSEDAEEINGWSTKTRVLGTYVISDTELNLDADSSSNEDNKDESTDSEKDVPNTGANDMINVVMACGILTMISAGAIALKKSK